MGQFGLACKPSHCVGFFTFYDKPMLLDTIINQEPQLLHNADAVFMHLSWKEAGNIALQNE